MIKLPRFLNLGVKGKNNNCFSEIESEIMLYFLENERNNFFKQLKKSKRNWSVINDEQMK